MKTRLEIEPSKRRILNIQHILVGNNKVVGSYLQWLEIYKPNIENSEYLFSLVGNLCIHRKTNNCLMLKKRVCNDI
jgi:hypothetical protein